MAIIGRICTPLLIVLLVAVMVTGGDAPARASDPGSQEARSQRADDRESGRRTSPDCDVTGQDVIAPGVVTGFFTYYESDPCIAAQKMAEVKDSGGDTLITFGFRLEQRTIDDSGRILTTAGEPDPKFSCWEGRRSCYDAAAASLSQGTIRRVLTYSGTEHFGSQMLRCARRDREVLSQGTRFQRVLLPVGNDQSCATEHDRYDLVLINNGEPAAADPVATMITAAQEAEVQLFLGLPKPNTNPEQPWLADITYLDSVERFTHRLLADWRTRYGRLDAFAGLYQSIEMPMKGNPAWDDQFALYAAQHTVAQNVLPDLPILLSPYIDARPRMTSPVDAVPLAVERMVEAGAGAKVIIAPQDGRGTGKGGVFFPDEADRVVDDRLAPVVGGSLTYAEAYFDASRAYYTAAAAAGREAGGDRFELWANLELMEPSPLEGEPACSAGTARGRATADRLMKQVAVAGDTITKIIGFDWDQMMQCVVPGKETLTDQLRRLGDSPAPTGLARVSRAGDEGMRITGYNLASADVVVRYRDAKGVQQSVSFAPSDHVFDQDFGRERPEDYPPGVQSIVLPWRPPALADDARWLSVDISTPHGPILYQTFTENW